MGRVEVFVSMLEEHLRSLYQDPNIISTYIYAAMRFKTHFNNALLQGSQKSDLSMSGLF